MKQLPKVILIILAIVLIGTGAYFLLSGRNESYSGSETDDAPPSVTAKYEELSQKYEESLSAEMFSCRHNNNDQHVFIVEGSGGFSGEAFFYDSEGSLIGSHQYDDIFQPGEDPDEPPVDRSAYSCSTIE